MDADYRRNLPATPGFVELYDRVREHDAIRSVPVQRARDFCVNLVTKGSQERGYAPRIEMVTRIFDFTLLRDALSGLSGPFENPNKEYWILTTSWSSTHDVKLDYSTGESVPMLTFYQRWLVARDLAVWEAEQRLATRTAASIAGLLNDLRR